MGQITTSTSDSDWQDVQDAVVRRRLQNRLAQRIHRQKYGRKDVKKKKLPYNGSAVNDKIDAPKTKLFESSQDPQKLYSQSSKELVHRSFSAHSRSLPVDESNFSTDISDSLFDELLPPSINPRPNMQSSFADSNYLIIPGLTTLSALLQNAALLKIPCFPSRGLTIHIHPFLPTPTSLAPTVLQGEIPHWPLVDLLPFSSLRDKLLQAGTLVKPEEFWNDMVNGGVRVWGPQPWEEMGWEVSEEFVRKWWFLMDDVVLRRANWWRGVRGDEPLDVAV